MRACFLVTLRKGALSHRPPLNKASPKSAVKNPVRHPRGHLQAALIAPSRHGLSEKSISPGARTVVSTLQQSGYQAELVGGCVRDLLLGQRPKDFDVVTDALPDEVRRVFRRARLIGRRFRLAHVRVGREVIEVSTYRAKPDSEENDDSVLNEHGRILRDNVFGTREEDVLRRDLTVNALYYDPGSNTIFDYVGGFDDIHERRLRFIGNPQERLNEDPVRMLRAVRFKTKLNLAFAKGIEGLIAQNAYLLRHVPPARLFDEVLKMFHHGYALNLFNLLRHLGMFAELFPEAERTFTDTDLAPDTGLVCRVLKNTDQRVQQGKPVIAAFLFAGLLWRAVCLERERRMGHGVASYPALQQAAVAVIGRESQRISIPRRVSSIVYEIWELQGRLESRRPRTIHRLLENKRFRAAYDFLVLRSGAGEVPESLAEWWTQIQEHSVPQQQEMIKALNSGPARNKRRRPRKRSNEQSKQGT